MILSFPSLSFLWIILFIHTFATQANDLCADLEALVPPSRVECKPETFRFDFGNPSCDALATQVAVVVQPETTQQVSAIVSYVHTHHETVQLSIRSGGHSYTCDSVRAGSVHIDLRRLDSVEILENTIDADPDPEETKLLKVGAGNTFVPLLESVDASQYTFVHGECFTVGVGGFYLHGGASVTNGVTNMYGLGNETIREMEVVTADGSVLRIVEPRQRTSETGVLPPVYIREPVRVWKDGVVLENGAVEYQNLWTALRIAGSSFGLVTSLTIQLFNRHEQTRCVYSLGGLFTSEQDLADLMDHDAQQSQASLSVSSVSVLFLTQKKVVTVALANGSRNLFVKQMQCLWFLGSWFWERGSYLWPLTHLAPFTTTAINTAFLFFDDVGVAYVEPWVSFGVGVSGDVDRRRSFEWHRNLLTTDIGKDCSMGLFTMDASTGGEREQALYSDLTCPADKYSTRVQELERESQVLFPNARKYRNLPLAMATDEENRFILSRYYGGMLDQLRQFKAEYDPNNVFSTFQGIDPL